ncbi:DUF504 domain-containing protein [Archaeoglobus neptunius]|uniref:DUF504 domain-containing protein n=1 Tax=Archaeoglobus neptunius TaxID=2798580 RepID=UPI001E3696C3|nr:DUF504 domain-containing protein [Archaeoglobus neptunius]
MRNCNTRDVLNRFKWHPELDFSKVRIIYIDRPRGFSEIRGDDIQKIGHMFLYLSSGAAIPHHRIVEIRYGDEVVWKRR